MKTDEVLLIDLSGIAHQIFHVSGNEPDPNFISTQVIARVRALATEHPHAAVCCDSGKSFRADIDPAYKAQRDTENRGVIKHQIEMACDVLRADGFPVWAVKGMEADDLIASATRQALAIDGASVLIASADKDLLQLVSDRVTAKSIQTGNILGPAEVFDKWGVKPEQMGDLIALMGDKSDNIAGAEKIGKVIGARLLSEHVSLSALFDKMAQGVVSGVTPAMRTNLLEFKTRWPTVAQLIALKSDVEIPFHEIAVEREAKPMEIDADADDGSFNDAPPPQGALLVNLPPLFDPAQGPLAELPPPAKTAPKAEPQTIPQPRKVEPMPEMGAQNIVPKPTDIPVPQSLAPMDFSQQLEPRNMTEAVTLAQRMFESRLFSAYGTPQAVLATVLAGRELGIPAMASLRAFHVIEGRPTLSAGTIQSLVIKSGKAKFFRCTERTNERATFETQRGDDPPVSLSFSVEDGRRAWPKDDAAFLKSGWGKNPADLCVARASSKLARLVYPDVVSGLYAPEEME